MYYSIEQLIYKTYKNKIMKQNSKLNNTIMAIVDMSRHIISQLLISVIYYGKDYFIMTLILLLQ